MLFVEGAEVEGRRSNPLASSDIEVAEACLRRGFTSCSLGLRAAADRGACDEPVFALRSASLVLIVVSLFQAEPPPPLPNPLLLRKSLRDEVDCSVITLFSARKLPIMLLLAVEARRSAVAIEPLVDSFYKRVKRKKKKRREG